MTELAHPWWAYTLVPIAAFLFVLWIAFGIEDLEHGKKDVDNEN